MDEDRRRGIVRIHVSSILKAIYGNTEYEAVSMRISKEDHNMLEITVSHPSLPEAKKGRKLPRVEVKQNEQTKTQETTE